MNIRFRHALWVGFGAVAMTAATGAWAALSPDALQDLRERRQAEAAEKAQPAPRPPRQEAPRAQAGGERGERGDRGGGNVGAVIGAAGAGSPAPRQEAPRQGPAPGQSSRGERSDRNDRGEPRGGIIGGTLDRNFGTGGRNDRGPRGDRDDRRNDWRHDRDDRRYYPPRVVRTLPYGYRHYYWNGTPYYAYGGHWYRPYNGSYIAIGVPYGLFVSTLPGAYTSFWYGSTRYFYADDTYYVYEPARRGYVVSRSPYGDDAEEEADVRDEDLFIYPARGQSEQQQADDRYECHRWAAKESGYDPIDDEYDAAHRSDYQRAMTACLTGRGYTVK